jgi:hypothetical protein
VVGIVGIQFQAGDSKLPAYIGTSVKWFESVSTEMTAKLAS